MKYVIDTDGRRMAGVKQVQSAIRKVQKMYPKATAEDILWGLAHMTAAANMDLYFEVYLAGFAKACFWTTANAAPQTRRDSGGAAVRSSRACSP